MLHIHCSLSFRGPHVRLALLTELPPLNKEFIIIIKGDNHSVLYSIICLNYY